MTEEVGVSEDLAAFLRRAGARLAEAGVPAPRVDAQLLAAHVLRVDVGEVQRLALLGRGLSAENLTRLEELIDARADRVPLQHLTGSAPFRHLELRVGPGVFVPRPETELLAGWAIDRLREAVDHGPDHRPLCVDLCTGSGAVALAVASEAPTATVVAVELSPEAVAWATHNRDLLDLPVELREGDAGSPAVTGDLDGTACVVVSNPPYVPSDAVPTEPEVAEHDPAMALYGLGPDGLHVPRLVAERAAHLLRPGGWFGMEHADVQGDALVAHLRADARWSDVQDNRDHADRPRFITARRA